MWALEIREEVLRRGLTEYPEVAQLSALSAAGAHAETIRAMRKNGARMRPADATAYIGMGHAQGMPGNFAEALEAYAEAKRLQPSDSAIYEGMGRVCGETGEL